MPDGNTVTIPDFALETTAQQMLKQLTVLAGDHKAGVNLLLKQAVDEAKETEKFRKDDESDREDLYKATLDIASAIRSQSKKAEKNQGDAPVVGAELPQTLTRLSQGATTTAAQIDTVGQSSAEAGELVGELGDSSDAAKAQLDKFNKGAAMGEKAFVKFYDGSMSAGKTLVASAILYGGLLVDSFVGLGQELNKLTASGVGFTDGLASGGMSATSAMMELSGQGLDAVSTLSNLSTVVQSMGKSAFVDLTESFLDATNKGVDLGMALEDSAERMGAELQKRQLMGALDGVNQARLQKTITTSIKNQQKYSAALGVSTDELVAFTDSLLSQTPALTANLMRLNGDLRNQVIGGITDFGTAMRGLGGEEGGQIAAAMTEAAASGAMGFSESMTGYVTALPSLAGPMNDYISAIQAGTLSQEDADQMAQDIASQLGNVSAAEKDRIFALARAGDAQAESMAKAIAQFEQSEKKLKDMNKGFTMSEVQKGTNTLTAIIKQITGTFDAIKTGFLVGLGEAGVGTKTITDAFKSAQKIIMDSIGKSFKIFGGTGDAFDDLTDGAESLGARLGKKLPDMIESVAKGIAGFIEKIPSIVEGIKSFASGVSSVFKVLSAVMAPVIFTFKLLAPIVSGAMDLLSGFAQGVIDTVLFPFKLLGSVISFVWNLMTSLGGAIKTVLQPAIDAVGSVFGTLGDAIGVVLIPFKAIGDAFSNFFGKFSGESGGFLKTLGYLAGIVTTVGVAMGKLSFSGLAKGIGSFASTLKSGAGKVLGGLDKGLSKATGGLSDKITGKFKEKFTGKAKEMDMGSKAMDTATKKSKSFTKTLATGMKDISKGISDVLTNLSKGISNSVSNIATGIQKGISALGKGIADAGKGIGSGIGGLLQGTLTGLGKGLKVLGDPKVLLGVAALTGIGAAMFVTGKAFQQFADINWAGVAAGAVALGVLGAAAFLIAPIAPVIGVGALAIGALGLALIPFAAAVKIAAPAMVELMGSFKLLNDVDPKNVLLLGPGLVSLAAGMAAFSAGGLISGVLDGLGSLFGSESPFDKLAKIGAAAPAIVSMTDNMNNMGQTVENFNTAIDQLDGKAAAAEFGQLAKGIDTLNESMDNINMIDLMKMAAMKTFGPIQQEQEPLVKKEGAMSPNDPRNISVSSSEAVDGDITEPTGPTVNEMSVTNAYERKQAKLSSRQQTMQNGGIASTVSASNAARAKAQAPAVAQAMTPAGQTVDQTAAKPTFTYTDDGQGNKTMSRTLDQDQLNDVLERMVAKQEQTNSLLRKGNRITSDLSDEF